MPRFLHGAFVGAGAGVIAGVLDAGLAGARGPVLALALVVSCGLFAGFGGVLGALASPIASALHRAWAPAIAAHGDRRSWGLTLFGAAMVGAAAFVALGRWAFASDPALVLVLVLALVLGVGGLVLALELGPRLRGRPRVQLVVATVELGVAMLLVRGLVDAGEGVDLRAVAVLAVAALAAVALAAAPRLPGARAIAIAIVALVVAAPAVLATSLSARFVAARHAPLSGSAARALGRVLDLDGDGFNPLFGAGDCAPFDGDVHPFGDEIADNGRDDDCWAGDVDSAELAARPAPPLPTALPPAAPHIVLVTVDTLRADRLGAYGYARDTTPMIDRIAAESTVFERAYSSSPVTDRSLPTLLGGLYPSMYTEALTWAAHEIAERRVLWPEVLAAAGWHTVVVTSTEVLSRDNLDQGIAELDLAPAQSKDASHATSVAFLELQEHARERPGTPLFLWVHYYDPHGPYDPPRQFRRWDDGGPHTRANRSDRYDAEVAYVDDEIGRLVALLRRTKLWPTTIFVVTSDHGEEFMDHGGWYHAEELYDESVRVPLVVRVPGLAAQRIAEPVGLVDLGATVLELAGLGAHALGEGRSLAPAIRGEADVETHPIVLEQWKHKTDEVQKLAVVRGRDKLILDLPNQLWELYDLVDDPAELHNRWSEDAATAEELRALVLDYWQRVRAARALALAGGSF
ncbi:MAG TPA: sulfatase [Nannocystaceae bacterium]|nr:sulfatase [Nannocystaceae bacterium]